MNIRHRIAAGLNACALLFLSAGGNAAELTVNFEIPAIDAAEYHQPYIAIWLSDEKRAPLAQIALWLEQEKWHRDLRSWWRRGGNGLSLPIDGVSGATRKPGEYSVNTALELSPGDYILNIEAVREVGGREHIRIPFTWEGDTLHITDAGKSELGAVALTISE